MPDIQDTSLIRRKYRDVFGASIAPAFGNYLSHEGHGQSDAMLGYRRAGEERLFLEAYLDRPVEHEVSDALGRRIARQAIVEIGNFAADNALAMIELWGAAANDLGGRNEVAVATLTAPLRRIFARIGIPVAELAPALPGRLGGNTGEWGRYYETDPRVCAGIITDGQDAIVDFLARRAGRQAA
jgi:hypothetical protein